MTLYKSLDGGASWTTHFVSTKAGSYGYAVAFDPANDATVYVGGSGSIYKSVNGGTSWTEIGVGTVNGTVADIAVDPLSPGNVYATTWNGFYKSANSGTTWKRTSTNGGNVIEINPVAPAEIFHGTGSGVFRSADSGETWAAMNDGLTNTSVESLTFDPISRILYAGTSGGSVYKCALETGTTPAVTVVSPNGGESWEGGSLHAVTWTSSGTVGFVKIEYSTNNGSSWTTAVASTANTKSYAWTVPNLPSANCLVRVSEATTGTPFDASDAAFAITAATHPIIQLSRSAIYFGAVVNAAGTGAQSIVIGNTGGGTLSWSATKSANWISVNPASGTGNSVVQIGASGSGLSAGTYQGTVTFADIGALNSPRTVNVTLKIYAAGASALPFGSFATPADGTTGVTGAIPVTGWVLDDTEVVKVDIKRDPHASDPGGAIGPDGLVFVGNGLFVEGARPDVEAAYPGYPFNYRAGWGYMLLTNFLPVQGNGTFKIHAFAVDREGNSVLLGTKTITCSNATAVKPFGTVDTPVQGGDASGSGFVNFGWVLTPMPKTVPKDGTTIDVYVDSVKLGNLSTAPNVYNQYRPDVAGAFPGLNNSGGPVGAFFLDTTTYANGVHTIFWIATDNAGQADGIGSRYFNVANMGGTAASSSRREERSDAAIPTMEFLSNLPPSFDLIAVKRGFNLTAPPVRLNPDYDGSYRMEIKEVERIELFLDAELAGVNNPPTPPFRKRGEARYAGYMIVGGELRPLPIGSTLDPKKGTFSWLPGPGFLGSYDLIFVVQDEWRVTRKIPVTIRITPKF